MPITRRNTDHPGYIASRTYATVRGPSGISAATAPFAIDTIYFYPFIAPARLPFVSGSMRVVTLGAGSAVKAAIWANSAVSNRALGAPLYVDNTGVATTSSSANVTLALGAGTLVQGTTYWIGTKFTGTLPIMYSISSAGMELLWMAGSSSPIIVTLSIADTYSSNMPTISEGAAFTAASVVVPLLFLNT